MIRNTNGTERLYLSKGEQTIFIENSKIPQHHIDGIRFLYRLYKKKKPGVIINNSLGYGRGLQVVLFLKAMLHLLIKPVLILCSEGAEHDWVEQFQTSTDLCDDVVLETVKPFIKKLVIINPMSNVAAFCRRDWSVLVVDGDKTMQVLGLAFNADFKVWITPVNLRKSLDKFAQIYKWFYPKEKFDKNDFIPDKNNLCDVVDKAVLLDALMQDVVFRNDDFSAPIESNQIEESTPKKRRKNKDATGTKIKRSKRKICDDEEDEDVPISKTRKHITKETITSNSSTALSNDKDIIDQNDENIDDSKDNSKTIENLEDFNESKEETELDIKVDSVDSELNLYYEPDSPKDDDSDIIYEMDTQELDNDDKDQSTKDIEHLNNIKASIMNEIDESLSKETAFDRDDTPSDLELEDDVQNYIAKNTNYDESAQNVKNKDEKAIDNTLSAESPTIFENQDIEIEMDTKYGSANSAPICDDIKSDNDEFETTIKSPPSNKTESDTQIDNNNETSSESPLFCIDSTPDIDDDIVSSKQNVQMDNVKVTNEVEPVKSAVSSPVKCSGDKLQELEDQVMNKYKGSILDSLF